MGQDGERALVLAPRPAGSPRVSDGRIDTGRLLTAAGVVRYLLTGPPLGLPVLPNWLNATAGSVVAVLYLTLSWAATGRSVGKQLAGLRVLDRP